MKGRKTHPILKTNFFLNKKLTEEIKMAKKDNKRCSYFLETKEEIKTTLGFFIYQSAKDQKAARITITECPETCILSVGV